MNSLYVYSNAAASSLSIRTIVALLLVSLAACSVATAATILVPGDYSTIQEAINAAIDGDEIIVSPNSYWETINIGGRNITLRSTDPTDPSVVADTTINASWPSDTTVIFSGTEPATCVLSGFTIGNGYATDGGGIRGNGTLATIQYNVISGNTADYGGGLHRCNGTIQYNTISDNQGFYEGGGLYQCHGTIQHNTISANSSSYGIGLADCDGLIQHNTITGNAPDFSYNNYGGGLAACDGVIQFNTISNNSTGTSTGMGGGLYECHGTIQYNTITANSAPGWGGGLDDCQGIIRNNIIANNSGGTGGGLCFCNGSVINNTIYGNSASYAGGGIALYSGFIANCIVWGNSAPTDPQMHDYYGVVKPFYCCIQDWTAGGRGNITDNPKFVDAPGGNLHLQSDSPCINTGLTYYLLGDPATDIDGECRVAGSAVDIGADETASSTDTDGDLLADSDESSHSTDPNNPDTDADGLPDGVEVIRGTNPAIADTPTGISVPATYSSIQQAISLAFPLEPITVSTGKYYENLRATGRNIILQGTNPLDDTITSTTEVNGNAFYSALWFEGSEDQNSVVKGITLRNGMAGAGGGIYGNNSLATIERNKIIQNASRWNGGGLSECNGIIQHNFISENLGSGDGGGGAAYCDGTIRNNMFTKNLGSSGGALYACPAYIHNNTFTENQAASTGGAIFDCDGTVEFNTATSNQAWDGPAISDSDGTMQHNTLTNNIGAHGGGFYNCNGIIQYNTVSNNAVTKGGGGLELCNGIIQDNTITDNSADEGGGGLAACDAIIQNNIISRNTAVWGGGGGLNSCGSIYQNSTIRNNTITDNTSFTDGGGLFDCEGTIENNTISGNSVVGIISGENNGGGLAECDGMIFNNIISDNVADYGAGLHYCLGTIQNNIITGNTARESCAGLFWCNGTVQNNIIALNTALDGGGGGVWGCDGIIQNNTIYGNSATSNGGGIGLCQATITNCIVWGNTAPESPQIYASYDPSYCCVQDWTGGGTSNITANPQLIDPAHNDFHLQPTSPCIDAGGSVTDLAQDFEGDPRPWDGTATPRGDGSDFDIGADEYFVFSCSYDFPSDSQGWASGSAIIFSAPQMLWQSGALKLISQTNTNTFGFWASPSDAVIADSRYLYRARFNVTTDLTDQSLVPQIRLRANSSNFQQSDYLTIESTGTGDASPQLTATAYDLYFLPARNDTYCSLAFDLLNFNPGDAAQAELALQSVLVERFALDALTTPTEVRAYEFASTSEGWVSGGAPIVFTNPEFTYDAGALQLRSTTNTNTFGFWSSTAADVTIAANLLYRGTFQVRTDVTSQTAVPQLRLRFNAYNLQASRTLGIESTGDGASSPGTASVTYDGLYFLPPAACIGSGLIASFDMLNFSPDDSPTASLILDRATIETLSPPTSP